MHKIIPVLFVLLLCVACGPSPAPAPNEPAPDAPPFQTYTMAQFMKTTSVMGGSFNKGETKMLVTSNQSGIFNVYSIDLATGEKTPLTQSQETTFGSGYFHHDDRFIYRADQGGNEEYHLYVGGGEGDPIDLTVDAGIRENFRGFAHDGNSFFVESNRRDKRFMDLYRIDAKTLERKMFYQNDVGMEFYDISRDQQWLTLGKNLSSLEDKLYLVNLKEGGEPKQIEPVQGGKARMVSAEFGPENRYLYYRSDEEGEFMGLYRYELATGNREAVRKAEWNVSWATFSHNGLWRTVALNWDGVTRLEIINTKTGNALKLPDLPEGNLSSVVFSRSGNYMRFYLDSDAAPANLYLYNLTNGKLTTLTDNLNPEIYAGHLVSSEVVRFNARDGLEIPGFLYKPKGASATNQVPALLWIHGGPGGQSRPSYRAEIQFLINHGYAIYMVNNRGSSGYGKTFFAADDRKHGKEPLWDCVDAKNYLKTLDWVNPEKIGIMGGSYGGYMTAAALAFEPDEFVIGINIFGVTNWIRTLENIPPYWESFRQALYDELGDPKKDREMLYAISPVFHGDKITKPIMILQGANDPRVVKEESDDLVEAIRKNNGIVEYVVFEDEGHGFRKSKNRIEGFEKVLKFADKYLKADKPVF
ncbi:MAG: S9 family peptidase [Acidobacteriota bacterium]|nr:S9 family peptidase [Acidobacteriota bacterium]